MKKKIFGIDFIDPKISINWDLKERELITLLKCEKVDSHIYFFEAKLYPVNIEVMVYVTFHDLGFKMEILVNQTKHEKDLNSNSVYIELNNTNALRDYVKDKFGSPRLLSHLFSKLNKPFYIYRYKINNIKVSHTFQDSVGGFYERLKFDVKY